MNPLLGLVLPKEGTAEGMWSQPAFSKLPGRPQKMQLQCFFSYPEPQTLKIHLRHFKMRVKLMQEAQK